MYILQPVRSPHSVFICSFIADVAAVSSLNQLQWFLGLAYRHAVFYPSHTISFRTYYSWFRNYNFTKALCQAATFTSALRLVSLEDGGKSGNTIYILFAEINLKIPDHDFAITEAITPLRRRMARINAWRVTYFPFSHPAPVCKIAITDLLSKKNQPKKFTAFKIRK